MFANIMPSQGGVVICHSFPVPAVVLTVELSNFHESKRSGSGFELVFNLFDGLIWGRIKVHSTGF